ncbi:MAG TPA: T9SS type A sorting domain-containing protein, partial [Cytophagales bacterium]|nr:T9SS type A sorting domain-containing protein [Cytophagales bacterium]
YTVHMYEPYEYTHQNQDWAGTGEGGKYPDPSKVTPPTDLTWSIGQYNNPVLPTGTTDWTYYEGNPFLVEEDRYILARPVCYAHKLGSGTAYYDDVSIYEVDALSNPTREIVRWNINDNKSIWFWSENKDGAMGTSTSGHGDKYAITSTGTSGYGSITLGGLGFKVEKGKRYVINGWMKGDGIPQGATASLTMELYYSPSGAPLYVRDKKYLTNVILKTSAYPLSQGYPVYFGEFGVVRNAFENDKGGERWVADVMQLFDSLGFSWTYHAYREGAFGLYEGTNGPVDTNTVNQLLKQAFENQLTKVSSSDTYGISQEQATLYPNPSKHHFKISLPVPTDVELTVRHLSGKTVFSRRYQSTNEIVFGEELHKGIYLCTVKTTHQHQSYKIYKE